MNKYDGLCISSGGIYGTYILGMLHYIFDSFDIDRIKYYAGTSVGALISLLLIISYKPIEILTYVCSNDINNIFTFDIRNFSDKYGIYDINNLKNYIKNMILKKIDYIPTFKDIFEKFNKYFICCSYCITTKTKVYFSHITTPDTSVLDAVLCSSSIPFVLTKCVSDDKLYVDGAVFDHFPLIKLISTMNQQSLLNNKKILGINIHSKKNNTEINSYNDYVSSILNIFIDVQNKEEDSEYLLNLQKKGIVDIIHFSKELCFNLIDSNKNKIENFCEGINVAKNHYEGKKIKTE